MLVTDYTSYADVRAALGVSSEDVEDATLALDLDANLLESDLEDVNSSVPSTYDTTKVLPTPTADETRFLKACQVFATFSVARQLTASLPLFAAKQTTDSKAGVQRFDNPYKDTIKALEAQYEKAKARLAATYATVTTTTTTTTTRTWFSVVPPASDPVTGT